MTVLGWVTACGIVQCHCGHSTENGWWRCFQRLTTKIDPFTDMAIAPYRALRCFATFAYLHSMLLGVCISTWAEIRTRSSLTHTECSWVAPASLQQLFGDVSVAFACISNFKLSTTVRTWLPRTALMRLRASSVIPSLFSRNPRRTYLHCSFGSYAVSVSGTCYSVRWPPESAIYVQKCRSTTQAENEYEILGNTFAAWFLI